jgi:hypothetical protein
MLFFDKVHGSGSREVCMHRFPTRRILAAGSLHAITITAGRFINNVDGRPKTMGLVSFEFEFFVS